MSFSIVKSTIESHIASNWTETAVQYENVDLNTDSLNEYISIHVLSGEGVQATLGDIGEYKVTGVLVVIIFTELGTGSKRAKELADTMSDLFRGAKINDITFKVPSGTRVAFSGSYYQFNLSIPFYSFFNM